MSNHSFARTSPVLLLLLAHGCAYGIVGPSPDTSRDTGTTGDNPGTELPPSLDDSSAEVPRRNAPLGDAAVATDAPRTEDHPPLTYDADLPLRGAPAPAPVDASAPEDVQWLSQNRWFDVPGSSDVIEAIDIPPARPPVRWLDVELDAPTNGECPGGWQVVAWGPTGEEVPSLQPAGQRLHLMVPWSWLGVLRFGARCAIVEPARWRDWSSWLGQAVRNAGVRRVTLTALDGVDRDLTDRTLVCAPPAVHDLHPDWPLSYYAVGEVALEPALERRCNPR